MYYLAPRLNLRFAFFCSRSCASRRFASSTARSTSSGPKARLTRSKSATAPRRALFSNFVSCKRSDNRSFPSLAKELAPAVRNMEQLAAQFSDDPERILPEPGPLESAKSYREKKAKPLLAQIVKVLRSLYRAYVELKALTASSSAISFALCSFLKSSTDRCLSWVPLSSHSIPWRSITAASCSFSVAQIVKVLRSLYRAYVELKGKYERLQGDYGRAREGNECPLPRPPSKPPLCFLLLPFLRLPALCVLHDPFHFFRAER